MSFQPIHLLRRYFQNVPDVRAAVSRNGKGANVTFRIGGQTLKTTKFSIGDKIKLFWDQEKSLLLLAIDETASDDSRTLLRGGARTYVTFPQHGPLERISKSAPLTVSEASGGRLVLKL